MKKLLKPALTREAAQTETSPDTVADCTPSVPGGTDQGKQSSNPLIKHELRAAHELALARQYGVSDTKLMHNLVDQLSQLQLPWSFGKTGDQLELATAALLESKPKTIHEAQLAIQMNGIHNLAVGFLKDATMAGRPHNGTDSNLTRAVTLMSLYLKQAEAMQRLKGQTGQRIVVERVTVNGGPTVVGVVNAPAPKPGEGDDETCAKIL